jgi:hypothetical protein
LMAGKGRSLSKNSMSSGFGFLTICVPHCILTGTSCPAHKKTIRHLT